MMPWPPPQPKRAEVGADEREAFDLVVPRPPAGQMAVAGDDS